MKRLMSAAVGRRFRVWRVRILGVVGFGISGVCEGKSQALKAKGLPAWKLGFCANRVWGLSGYGLILLPQ